MHGHTREAIDCDSPGAQPSTGSNSTWHLRDALKLRSDQRLDLGGADCPGPTRPWFIQQPIASILIEPVAPLEDRMCSAANRSDNQQGWRCAVSEGFW